ncbi:hypothetical protein JHK84_034373 [Glycine max]|nr:hypothetical protein JHK85_034746 [Glycine max]KAG4986416.1 hypothetical protein JHK86_034107 [Glycine max]KAG5140605.1 hypothetical protein JHK84_034373 [Glycine max]
MGLSVLEPEISFSSLSNSLVSWAETTWAMNMTCFAEDKFDILKHNNLNSAKEGRGVLVIQIGVNEQVMYMHWSGAASTILDNCALYYDIIGEFHATENQKIKFGQVIQEMGDASLKLIAFAYRQTDGEQLQQEELIAQTVFLEEEDHRREGRVPSSRKRFWELSDRREDKDYLGDTQMF